MEQPGRGDYLREISYPRFVGLNRNKKSVSIDLKTGAGKEIFYRLVSSADVVMEGNRPGVAQRLGIDYETLRHKNPGIIYGAISGYGQESPYGNWPGHDVNYMGVAGALTLSGEPGEPPDIPVADFSSAMFAVIGILSAILVRGKTGAGQFVDVSMTDGVLSWMTPYLAEYLMLKARQMKSIGRISRTHYGIFKAKDGKHITLGVIEDWFWENLCKVIGREDMAQDPRFEIFPQRAGYNDEIRPILEEVILKKSSHEWIRIMNDNNVPCGPVNSFDEVCSDEHVLKRDMLGSLQVPGVGELRLPKFPIKFTVTEPVFGNTAPALGQNNEEVLLGLNYTYDEIAKFKQEKII